MTNITDPAQQEKARREFGIQSDLISNTHRLLAIALVRQPLLVASIPYAMSLYFGRVKTEQHYVIGCALRVWTHFNPQGGYHAQSQCLHCGHTIKDTKEVAIVMLALPPWHKKTRVEKTAFMSGFFCSACDLLDAEAQQIWSTAMERQGVPLLPLHHQGNA